MDTDTKIKRAKYIYATVLFPAVYGLPLLFLRIKKRLRLYTAFLFYGAVVSQILGIYERYTSNAIEDDYEHGLDEYARVIRQYERATLALAEMLEKNEKFGSEEERLNSLKTRDLLSEVRKLIDQAEAMNRKRRGRPAGVISIPTAGGQAISKPITDPAVMAYLIHLQEAKERGELPQVCKDKNPWDGFTPEGTARGWLARYPNEISAARNSGNNSL